MILTLPFSFFESMKNQQYARRENGSESWYPTLTCFLSSLSYILWIWFFFFGYMCSCVFLAISVIIFWSQFSVFSWESEEEVRPKIGELVTSTATNACSLMCLVFYLLVRLLISQLIGEDSIYPKKTRNWGDKFFPSLSFSFCFCISMQEEKRRNKS